MNLLNKYGLEKCDTKFGKRKRVPINPLTLYNIQQRYQATLEAAVA